MLTPSEHVETWMEIQNKKRAAAVSQAKQDDTIPALTLWQPWAWLIAEGLKQYETRGWATKCRGPLAIHAALRKPKVEECSDEILVALRSIHPRTSAALLSLDRGAVVCIVDLVECIPVERLDQIDISIDRAFGNFSTGRYAWKLANVRKFNPIPAKGAQGLWRWTLPEGMAFQDVSHASV